jgi:hypothetical protein
MGGWLRPRPGRFTPGNEACYPLYGRRGRPQGRQKNPVMCVKFVKNSKKCDPPVDQTLRSIGEGSRMRRYERTSVDFPSCYTNVAAPSSLKHFSVCLSYIFTCVHVYTPNIVACMMVCTNSCACVFLVYVTPYLLNRKVMYCQVIDLLKGLIKS